MKKLIKWLIEEDNPSVKFYTLTEILNEKTDKGAEDLLRKDIESCAPVSSIMALQENGGWWHEDKYSFSPLYKNTFWQVYFLSLLGATKQIFAVDKAVKLIIANMQSEKGAFPVHDRYTGNLICFQGMTLEMLLRLGYFEENFTSSLSAFISDIVYRNDFRCKYRAQFKCPWGAVKVLKALNLIPPEKRDHKVSDTISRAVKFLLSHDIVEANYPRKKMKSRQWYLFSFPRGFQSDILETTSALIDAGCKSQNSNLRNALKYINEKRLDDGKWKMEYSLNGKMLVDIEKNNKPSKWISYFALKSFIKSKFRSI
jgi:hypothetical protein